MFVSPGEPNAVNYAGMVKLIAENGVFGGQHDLKQPSIGVEAAGIQNGILSSVETSNLLL